MKISLKMITPVKTVRKANKLSIIPDSGLRPNDGKRERGNRGFTLIEIVVGIAIVAMIIGSFSQITDQILLAYRTARERQDLVPQARYALDRMAMFAQESDRISLPSTGEPVEMLVLSERAGDQYNNATYVYAAAGDSLPDADNDANGLINNTAEDPADFITFDLDKTDAANWRLMEQMPDYGTSLTSDFKAKKVICTHVQAFSCRRISPGRVEISLSVQRGNTAVTFRTTAKTRWME